MKTILIIAIIGSIGIVGVITWSNGFNKKTPVKTSLFDVATPDTTTTASQSSEVDSAGIPYAAYRHG